MIQSPVLPLSICLSHLFIYLASCRDRPMISIMSRCQISIQAIIYFSHPLEPRQDIQSIVPFTYSQQTRHIDPLLDQCWANVVDGGPTLIQHWIGVSYLVDSILNQIVIMIIHHIILFGFGRPSNPALQSQNSLDEYHSAVQSQQAVTAHFSSKQLLHFGFAPQNDTGNVYTPSWSGGILRWCGSYTAGWADPPWSSGGTLS